MHQLLGKTSSRLEIIWSRFTFHAPNILLAVGTLIVGYVFYKLTAAIFRKLLLRSDVQNAFAHLLIDNVYKGLIFILTLGAAAWQLGINVVAPLAGLGILGLAVGFAAQDSLANIIAGFLIFFDKPFRVRDYVSIGEHYGRVELITMRSTRIRTQDNKYVVIPNQKIINEILIDHTTNGVTRLLIPVTITFESSLPKAREAILKHFENIEGVLKSPAPDVVLDTFGTSGINLLARFWIADAAEERKFHFAATEATKNALDEARITIAYPHVKLVGEQP